MAEIKITGNTGDAVQAVNRLNNELNQTEQEQKQIKKSTEDTTKEMKEGAKESGSAWTELNSKLEVVGKGVGFVKDAFIKFHEIQIQGRKENLQWQSMLNSTRANEIVNNMDRINATFGDNIDKARKMKMAYAAAFSDISYNVEDFGIIAQNMAQRMGKDVDEVAEELQQMLLKGDMGMLEDMGLLHNADIELQKYAGSIGKAVDELTDFEVRQGQTKITMKYLNTEFNTTKPLQDDYINLTNKAMNATDGFSGVVANLTDEIFNLNSGMDNLSVAAQMKKVKKEIDDAKKIIETGKQTSSGIGEYGSDSFYGAGLEEIANDKDVEDAKKRIESANSKLLSLQNQASNIYSGKLIKDYGIRKAESKKEIQSIMKQIKEDTDKAQQDLKGFMANGTLIVNENSLALMTRVQSLKTVYAEAQKEMSALQGIKKTKSQIDAENAIISEGIAQEMAEWKENNRIKMESEKNLAEYQIRQVEKVAKAKEDAILREVELEKKKVAYAIKSKEYMEYLLKGEKQLEIDLSKEKTDILNDFNEGKLFQMKFTTEELSAMSKEELKERIKNEGAYYDTANRMAEMGLQASANFTSMLINDVLLGEKEFRKEMIGDFVKGIGNQMVADGTFHIFSGLAKSWANPAVGLGEAEAGAAEVGAGIALGATAKVIGTTSGSQGKDKDTTAKDSNQINDNKTQTHKVNTYLFPSKRAYNQNLQQSNAEIYG